jgi:hypothetical protein
MKYCKGCGLTEKSLPLDGRFLACCPDNNWVEVLDYSIIIEKTNLLIYKHTYDVTIDYYYTLAGAIETCNEILTIFANDKESVAYQQYSKVKEILEERKLNL